ncbi:MAG TPA: biopolymer transporter ExbD [Opitutaceae bacterium]|nr:biopolymer transporter ExbD [Opitutaceae bacterium]
MITQPLEFQKHLRPPPRSLDVFFFVNVGVLALFLSLFTAKFVLLPGYTIELPVLADPVASARTADLVVNLQRDNLILFEGGRYSLDGFRQKLAEVVAEKGPMSLLLRADKQVSSQALAAFSAAVLEAKCSVQVAADVRPADAN